MKKIISFSFLKKIALGFTLFCILCNTLFSQNSGSLIKFTENKNQWASNIKYKAQLDGGELFLENNCLTYNFYDKDLLRELHQPTREMKIKNSAIRFHAYKVHFENASPEVRQEHFKPTRDYCNFFIGNNPSQWASKVKSYKEVVYTNLYSGINMQILGKENSIKYNFFVSPGANPSSIAMRYEGTENLELHKGELSITTSLNSLTEHKPVAWQIINNQKIIVPCRFNLENTTIRFEFPDSYDKNYELIIDPILVFASSSGSTSDNFGMTATYDSRGNLYSGGTSFGAGYPITTGAYDMTYNGAIAKGRTDVVITKYDSSGSYLHYSTYIGGTFGSEIVTSLVVDAQDNLFLYGATGSPDFPVSSNAFDKTFNGGSYLSFVANGTKFGNGTDIYVSKFNSSGTTLLGSTYIGGSKNDGVNHNNDTVFIPGWNVWEYPLDSLQFNYGDQYRGEIQVDKQGNCYIASSTRSSDFPIVGGFDNTLGGKQDAVVFKFNPSLSSLIWSSYLGGQSNDAGYALVVDDTAQVYITGGTSSTDFPTKTNAASPQYNGGKADGFIAKINANGNNLLCATYIGTPSYDQSYFIQNDKKNNVYVFGQSLGNMPVLNAAYSNPNGKQFITKLNSNLTNTLYSTVIGSGKANTDISPSAFLIDYCEKIYLSGWGGNIVTGVATSGMPLTSNAINSNTDGFNFYLMVLDQNASSLIYASYFGGSFSREHVDGGTSRFDKRGIIYQSVCAGCGGLDDFPVSPGAWPNTGTNVNHSSNCNNGTFKFDFQVPLVVANFSTSQLSGCAPLTVNFQNHSSAGSHFLWDFGNKDTTSLIKSPIKTYTQPGTYLVKLFVRDSSRCNIADSTYTYIKVFPAITAHFNYSVSPCGNVLSFSDSSYQNPVQWDWNFGDNTTSTLSNPNHQYSAPGNYTVSLIATNSNNCKDTITRIVQLLNFPPIAINASQQSCPNLPVQLNASGGIAYSWSPASSLNSSTISNPIASPTINTTYTVQIATINSVGDTCYYELTTTVNVTGLSSSQLMLAANPDTITKGNSSALTSTLSAPYSIQWAPSNTLNNPNSFTPMATPNHTTTYTATATDINGCTFILNSVTVYVITNSCNESVVFVPNTFTPNGDGKNDVLFVRSNFLNEVYFAVYNRWGQMVFETTDITKGWDGVYNGMKADPGVFGYYLKVKCNNGEESFRKGNISLIR